MATEVKSDPDVAAKGMKAASGSAEAKAVAAGAASGGGKMVISASDDIDEGGGGGGAGESKAEGPGDGGSAGGDTSVFKFSSIAFSPPSLAGRDMKSKLTQWNLDELTSFSRFHFGERFVREGMETFLVDLFNDATFRKEFQVVTSSKARAPVAGRVTRVDAKSLRSSVMSMEFFDRCIEADLVSEAGHIRRTWEEMWEGIPLDDKLRQAMLSEDNENYDLFDDDEREEFLFEVFRVFVTGGALNQYDDMWNGYLEATKGLYKDLLSVHRNESTGKIEVSSIIMRVDGWECDTDLFPSDKPTNRLFVIVDPLSHMVTLWYSPWVSFW